MTDGRLPERSPQLDTVIRLSVAVFLLMAGAATAGLLQDSLYRDNLLVRSGWRGNDLVTLLLAVPLLGVSGLFAARGSGRGLLSCLGILAYALYNYAFYVFGAVFNSLFLAYVGILALSTFGLIAGIASPEAGRAARNVRIEAPDRAVGIFMIGVAAVLALFWIAASLGYLWTGVAPSLVSAVDHPTNVAGALDLWLVVSFGLLGGVWLWQRRGWGYVIGVVWTLKGALYNVALSSASVAAFLAGATDDLVQLGLWLFIAIGCIAGFLVLIRAQGASLAER